MKTIPITHQEHNVTTVGFIRRGYSSTGGAEAYLKRLAAGLLAQGYRVVLLGTGAWPVEAWPGGEVVTLANRSLHEFSKQVLESKKKYNLDLLFSLERVPGCDIFRAGDGVHAAWLAHRKRREFFLKSWFSSWMPRHRSIMAMEHQLFAPQESTLIIANSAMVAQEIEHYFSFPKAQVRVIPNGVPPMKALTQQERRGAREIFGMREREFVVLFVGSGWRRKGLEIAIAAVDKMISTQQAHDRPVCLYVAGRGRRPSNPSKAVRFLGPIKKMELLYSAADLFILPTLYDPFSNASLEALVAGLPVITTRSNGSSEIIEEGVHGSLVDDPSDVEAFARAISCWHKRLNGDDATKTRETCRRLGASFSMERNIESTMEVLEEALVNRSLEKVSH
jgi:UDP-glucose:(heptosyl)LPS alpha-1,3-glucosyltransferase